MTSATTSRRRERPRRLVTAATLVLLSAAAVLAALVEGSTAVLSLAAVLGVALGALALRLAHAELLAERHEHATDRAHQAQGFRALVVERSAEHALFASQMNERLRRSEGHVRELGGMLRLAEARGDEAEDRARRERRRAVAAELLAEELESRLDRRPLELVDDLAAWDPVTDDVDTVVDLLAWEDRAAPAPAARRRHA